MADTNLERLFTQDDDEDLIGAPAASVPDWDHYAEEFVEVDEEEEDLIG